MKIDLVLQVESNVYGKKIQKAFFSLDYLTIRTTLWSQRWLSVWINFTWKNNNQKLIVFNFLIWFSFLLLWEHVVSDITKYKLYRRLNSNSNKLKQSGCVWLRRRALLVLIRVKCCGYYYCVSFFFILCLYPFYDIFINLYEPKMVLQTITDLQKR